MENVRSGLFTWTVMHADTGAVVVAYDDFNLPHLLASWRNVGRMACSDTHYMTNLSTG